MKPLFPLANSRSIKSGWRSRASSVIVILVLACWALSPVALTEAVGTADPAVERIAGSGRVETSISVARHLFPCDSEGRCADTVLLARADDSADAVVAGPLARALGAPLLLTDTHAVPTSLDKELERLGARSAVLLGGPAALSIDVEQELSSRGLAVERVGGSDRYETSALVAERLTPAAVAVASGAPAHQVDALAAGAWAGSTGGAVLLVAETQVPEPVQAALAELAPSRVLVVGGSSAVEESVAARIRELVPVEVERVSGGDRFQTAAQLASLAPALGADPSTYWVANGWSWPDIAVATAAAVHERALVLLADRTSVPPSTSEQLTVQRPLVERVRLIGGAIALSETVEGGLVDLLHDDRAYESFEVRVETDRQAYQPGEVVAINIQACNADAEPYRQTGVNPLVEVEVLNAVGLPVADNYMGRNFTTEVFTVEWVADECKPFGEDWHQRQGPFPDDGGDFRKVGPRAAPGGYRIRVQWNGREGNRPYPPVHSDTFLLNPEGEV